MDQHVGSKVPTLSTVAPQQDIAVGAQSTHGNMFPSLPPAYTMLLDGGITDDAHTDALAQNAYFDKLAELGKNFGPMREYVRDNEPAIGTPAGVIHMWQFLVHEITHSPTGKLLPVHRKYIPNFNTPSIDLDCLYFLNPQIVPSQYCAIDPFLNGGRGSNGQPCMFVFEPHRTKNNVLIDDFSRTYGRANIGDKRNDEFSGVGALQLLWMKFHNAMAEHFCRQGVVPDALFDMARNHTIWHWHRMIENELLPAVTDAPQSDAPQFYDPEMGLPSIINVILRFGHSMIPRRVPTVGGGDIGIFDNGHFAAPDYAVDVRKLFGIDVIPQLARPLDPKLAHMLMRLPDKSSLAARNLQREVEFGMPSYRAIVDAMVVAEFDGPDVVTTSKETEAVGLPEMPLWYGMLHNASDSKLDPYCGLLLRQTIEGLIDSSWLCDFEPDFTIEYFGFREWFETASYGVIE